MSLFQQIGQKCARAFGVANDLDAVSAQEEGDKSSVFDADFLSDLLHYRLYDSERKIYENKKSFGFVLEVVPALYGSRQMEQEIASLIKEIGTEGANVQALLFADNRISPALDKWASSWMEEPIFTKIAERKKEFFLQQEFSGNIPPRIFRFFFSFSCPKPEKQAIHSVLERLDEKRQKAVETFSRLSIVLEVKPNHLLEMLSGLINFQGSMENKPHREWDVHNWLSKQVCLPGSAIEVSPTALIFRNQDKNMWMKTYEALDFPDTWSLGQMSELLGDFFNGAYRIPTPFYLHYGIHFPVQRKAEMKFRTKMKVLSHQSKFPSLLRMFPDLGREMEEHLFVQKQLLEGEKFVETRLSCGLWAPQEQLCRSESVMCALFQKYGFRLMENHFVHFPDFLSSLPMAWGEDASHIAGLKRVRCMRTTLTQETASLIPCVGEWWGNSKQGMLCTGRRGQLAAWDPFASEGNLNTVVVGPSGSGKSVFMQEMLLEHLGQGGRVFVLDLGRSFEKLCALLEGQYLNFSEKSNFYLNPFRVLHSDLEPDALNAALEMVSAIVATMADSTQHIDKERKDIINSLIKAAWEKEGKNASVDTVIALLDQMQFHSEWMLGKAESLKEGLKKYSTQGIYARYFYGSDPIDFTNRFVVIETEELKNMPDLQAVILQMFTLAISHQIFMGDRKQKCMICIDEAWDLLKSAQMEGFIESLARRLRKYNGALVVGTQSIKDFDRSFGAKAAFQNSNWLVMLGKDQDSINLLKKDQLIPWSDYREQALASLRMEPGKYAEFMVYHKGSNAFSINQLKLDPFSALLYSTNANEFQTIQSLKQQGFSLEDALEQYLKNKQKDVL